MQFSSPQRTSVRLTEEAGLSCLGEPPFHPRTHQSRSRVALSNLTPEDVHSTSSSDEALLNLHPDQLFEQFYPLVRRLVRQYGDNPEIRNDLEGEIYYRFCLLVKAYDPSRGVPLRPYLVRQLTASIYSYARQYWRRQYRETSLEVFRPSYSGKRLEDPTDEWDNAIELEKVKHVLPLAVAKLSERQRKVVIWRYFEDLAFVEIAERLGIQTSTARSLLRHGLNRLRLIMNSCEAAD